MQITAIESNRQFLDGGAMFGNAPRPVWEKWIAADERGRIPLACRCFLLQYNGKNILLETGIGSFFDPSLADRYGVQNADKHMLLENLKVHGFSEDYIDIVILSHLHFDHAGAANFFLSSKVIMQKEEWNWAFGGGSEFLDTTLFDGLKSAGISMIDGDHDVFGDGSVRLIFTPGHTPGHQTLLLTLENTGPIMLSGDLYHTRANRSLRRAPTFNHDAAQTLESMDRVEQLLAEQSATLWIEHDKALADTLKMAPHFYD